MGMVSLDDWLAPPDWNFSVEDLRGERDFLLNLLSEDPVPESPETDWHVIVAHQKGHIEDAGEPEAIDSLEVPAFSLRHTPRKPPPWRIGFAESFLKETRRSDRKLLGRVLEALEELSAMTFPLAPKGDTFKRLTGDLDGFWRYRIGDHRVIIRPDLAESTMIAVSFGPRGSIYD